MGVQDSATQEILRLAREQAAQNAELMPLQKEALQFGLDAGKTAYQQSQEDRTYALGQRDKFTGLTDKMVADANAFDSEAEQSRRAGAAMADAGSAYSNAIAANQRDLASMGIMPGSGRQLALREAAAADASRAQVGAANDARLSARNEGRALIDRAAGALSGAPIAATNATGTGAAIASGGVGTANAGAGGINAGYGALTGAQQAAGGLAGSTGANAAGMYGVQANYKLASDQQNQGWLGGIGSLIGGAARVGTWLAPTLSDRRTKTNIERIGMHPLGIGIYSFEFKPEHRAEGGAGRHVGVMADEVRRVLPAAVRRGADGFDRVDYGMLGV